MALHLSEEKAVDLARIWGAMAWPVTYGGYTFVLAQPYEGKPLYIVGEAEGSSVEQVVTEAMAMDRKHHVSEWYCEGKKKGSGGAGRNPVYFLRQAYEVLDRLNRGDLSLCHAPYGEDAAFCLDLLVDHLSEQRIKIQSIADGGTCPRMLAEIGKAASRNRQDSLAELDLNPALQALLYLLGALSYRPVGDSDHWDKYQTDIGWSYGGNSGLPEPSPRVYY